MRDCKTKFLYQGFEATNFTCYGGGGYGGGNYDDRGNYGRY